MQRSRSRAAGERRDGLERLEVGEYATVGELKQAISSKMGVPYQDIILSQDKALVGQLPWQCRC